MAQLEYRLLPQPVLKQFVSSMDFENLQFVSSMDFRRWKPSRSLASSLLRMDAAMGAP